MSKRLILAAIVYPMANAVLFGLGAIMVLTLFDGQAKTLLPLAIGVYALAARLNVLTNGPRAGRLNGVLFGAIVLLTIVGLIAGFS